MSDNFSNKYRNQSLLGASYAPSTQHISCAPYTHDQQNIPTLSGTQYNLPSAQYNTPNAPYNTPNAPYNTPNAPYNTPNTQYNTPNTQYNAPNTHSASDMSQNNQVAGDSLDSYFQTKKINDSKFVRK